MNWRAVVLTFVCSVLFAMCLARALLRVDAIAAVCAVVMLACLVDQVRCVVRPQRDRSEDRPRA